MRKVGCLNSVSELLDDVAVGVNWIVWEWNGCVYTVSLGDLLDVEIKQWTDSMTRMGVAVDTTIFRSNLCCLQCHIVKGRFIRLFFVWMSAKGDGCCADDVRSLECHRRCHTHSVQLQVGRPFLNTLHYCSCRTTVSEQRTVIEFNEDDSSFNEHSFIDTRFINTLFVVIT